MTRKIDFLQDEVSFVNRLIRDMARDFQSFARKDRVEQAPGSDYLREVQITGDLTSQLEAYFA